MDCLKCSISDICIIAKTVKMHSLKMDISVTNCQIKNNLNQSFESNNSLKVDQSMGQLTQKAIKTYKDFNQVSNELRGKENGADCKIKISTDIQDVIVKEICPTCGGETTSDDLILCDNEDCNVITCSNCRTESEGKNYCESCWIKL